jgi:hypothetical protein
LEVVAGHLRPEPQGDALVGLDVQDQRVRFQTAGLPGADRQVRRPLELQHHLGDALGQTGPCVLLRYRSG